METVSSSVAGQQHPIHSACFPHIIGVSTDITAKPLLNNTVLFVGGNAMHLLVRRKVPNLN
jgi:hypothetical protein